MLVIAQLFTSRSVENEIRYDEFKAKVRDGQVSEVVIASDTIYGRWTKTREPREQRRRGVPMFRSERQFDFETVRVPDEKLVDDLEAHRVKYKGRPEGTQWLPLLLYGLLPVLLMLWLWRGMMRRVGPGAGGVLSFGKSKGSLFNEDRDVKVTFEDVAGVPEAKEELQEIIEFLRNPEKFTRLGAKIPKGVLLVGPPGTGKTLLARAVAGEAKVPFFSISGSEIVEMFVGVGAARVRDLFEQAAGASPCIVFIDELDALGKSRGAGVIAGNEEREQTLNQLLVEMDGFDPNKGVIIMAATNRPEILDTALLRPGRFDRQVLVDRPDWQGREEILRVHARKVKLGPDVDLRNVARRTPGFSGADLANVVNEAALLAARYGREAVEMRDLSESIDRVVAGLEKKSRIITEPEKRRIAYHEVGHALVGEVLAPAERVQKISIVPRGLAALGYTMQLPTEDRHLLTESELRGKLATLLGGRAAEEVVFGEVSTGAQNDLQHATEIARAMVVDYGMNEAVGPVSLGHERRAMFLPAEYHPAREIGDALADQIDQEVRAVVEEARQRAVDTLRSHRALLDEIARTVIEKERLEGPELRDLLERVHQSNGADQPAAAPAGPTSATGT
ncbi:MAG: ATP-dependent zinc metalloprotease FtsH [Deltaproteobacteria bacterium]|nr:ATP-dependent zinc metalloprotease FtsH [Deltaproteobacteria bacterium]